jgi:hypothetical protein
VRETLRRRMSGERWRGNKKEGWVGDEDDGGIRVCFLLRCPDVRLLALPKLK